MAADAPIPQWATDKRELRIGSFATGIALCSLITIVAANEPSVLQALVNVLFVPSILVAAAIALPVIGLRMLLLGKIKEGDVAATYWLMAFILSTLPIGIAILLLGAIATAAFVLELSAATALVQGIVGLLGTWMFASLAVKFVINLQLLLRYWAKR